MQQGPLIFDSHSLLKFFQKEMGYEKVIHLLEEIRKTGETKYINAINLGEIIYSAKKEFGDQKKLEVLSNIERLNFTILPISNNLVSRAAEFKAQYAISYADCFPLSSTVEYKATLVTGDLNSRKPNTWWIWFGYD